MFPFFLVHMWKKLYTASSRGCVTSQFKQIGSSIRGCRHTWRPFSTKPLPSKVCLTHTQETFRPNVTPRRLTHSNRRSILLLRQIPSQRRYIKQAVWKSSGIVVNIGGSFWIKDKIFLLLLQRFKCGSEIQKRFNEKVVAVNRFRLHSGTSHLNHTHFINSWNHFRFYMTCDTLIKYTFKKSCIMIQMLAAPLKRLNVSDFWRPKRKII